jgi:hypothetical protein
MSEGRADGTRWSIERHVPVLVVITLCANAALAIWYASQADARLTQVEKAQISAFAGIATLNDAREKAAIEITHLDDSMQQILAIVQRLDRREGGEPGPASRPTGQ